MGIIAITATMIVITMLLIILRNFIEIEFALILIVLMFILDGIFMFLLKDILDIPNKEIALGILLGMVIRVIALLMKQN
tara:strand:- start:354 stop:590 length:237 start_codon:yes stop_codon:yes gene_type:complete